MFLFFIHKSSDWFIKWLSINFFIKLFSCLHPPKGFCAHQVIWHLRALVRCLFLHLAVVVFFSSLCRPPPPRKCNFKAIAQMIAGSIFLAYVFSLPLYTSEKVVVPQVAVAAEFKKEGEGFPRCAHSNPEYWCILIWGFKFLYVLKAGWSFLYRSLSRARLWLSGISLAPTP